MINCQYCQRQFAKTKTVIDSFPNKELPGVNASGIFLRKKKTPSPREHWEFFFCLHRAGIETIGKLTDTTVADLKRIRNFGKNAWTKL